MNRENIQKVRDLIASLPAKRFDMGNPLTPHNCGSAACIGGWANFVRDPSDRGASLEAAAEWLGLPNPKGLPPLFFPGEFTTEGFDPYCATSAQAVQVLDHLLATGEVDWSIIEPARAEVVS